MKRAAIVTAIVGMLVSLADAPLAQVTDGLAIEVVVSEVSPTRGEVLRGGSSIPADRIDTTISTAYLGFHENTCGNLSRMATPADVSGTAEQVEGSAGRMMPSDNTWVVDVTPLRVTADVATFKVRWVRTRDNRRRSSQPSGEMELSLRPGQSLPLDMSSMSPPLGGSEPCVRSLRIGVARTPSPERDDRLVATDVWLIEHMPDGSERSQAQSLRGQYNRGISFYFDRIQEGSVVIDLSGQLEIAPGASGNQLKVTMNSRRVDLSQPIRLGSVRIESATASATLMPNEVVSVALPPLGVGRAPGPPVHRLLSLRIRLRPLR